MHDLACRACHGQAPSRIFGSCVVLPEPVWPDTITTWERLTALAISSRAADTGSSAGYSYFMTNFNDTEALGARVFARSEPLAERIVQPGDQRIGTEILLHYEIGGTAHLELRQPKP